MLFVVALMLIAASVASTVAAIETANRYLVWHYANHPDREF